MSSETKATFAAFWHGEYGLGKAFFGLYIFIPIILIVLLIIIGGVVAAKIDPILGKNVILALPIYFIWAAVGMWRSASFKKETNQGFMKGMCFIVRALVILFTLGAINTLIKHFPTSIG